MAADLYCDLHEGTDPAWRACLPGLSIALLGALAAGFIADRYGAPLTLMALLVGMALNFLAADDRLAAGLAFASGTLLRIAIVLVGARVTYAQIIALGPFALLSITLIVALTLGSGLIVARRLGLDSAFGILAGGAVAICGASAAMAIATTLGESRAGRERLAMVLVAIAAFSAAAMVTYPLLAHLLQFSDRQAGFMLGASIHDVAQAVAAGYSFSDSAGPIAAVVKVTRVALLAPVLAIIALFVRKSVKPVGVGLPWFVLGFFVVAAVNSFGILPAAAVDSAGKAGTGLLAIAVTAAAIRSPLGRILKMGWKPFCVVGIATLTALCSALATVALAVS
ncbi:MAG: putative sulfate exporter family transporter [Pseudomonadota bacterium]|nr:putative sulfate exporter family transporter [Pseudomonadota bacterium]